MDALSVARSYFDAWNRHDPAAIVACFRDDGTYRDAVSGPLTGDAIARHAEALFDAFTDLRFELVGSLAAGERVAAVEWVMRGTHTGPFMGLAATDRVVELPGADVVRIESGGIRAVAGYFDRQTLAEQLGLQTVVQPQALGDVRFGTSVYRHSGRDTLPGAFSLTSIHLRSPEEMAEADAHGTAILEELAGTPGFISTVLTTIGDFGHTITAWEDAEAPRAMLKSGAHKAAVASFFGPAFAAGGWTSVWVPARINASWIRCRACSAVRRHDHAGRSLCACGVQLPERLPYW